MTDESSPGLPGAEGWGKGEFLDLFEGGGQRNQPLAARMRPRTLEEFFGQAEIVGPGRLLRRAIEADRLSSLILWGPPGTGKTSLAAVIARSTKSHFETLNAVMAGVADIRKVVAGAQRRRQTSGQRTILLVDEIHRFNRAQQDALLPHVEDGTVILIGATTENPYFDVNTTILSRSRVFQFRPLDDAAVARILRRALADGERGLGGMPVAVDDAALGHLVRVAGGDARSALNALELAVATTPPDPADGTVRVGLREAEQSIQRRALRYDRAGDEHYDTVSAFIKSVRGSDPDAALYWLAKMLAAGEDPRFVLRRLVILAGEDVGLADPLGLLVANAAAEAFERIGLPEGVYPLVEATLYLATAPKSNSALAYFRAAKQVEAEGKTEVPGHLRDASRDGAALGHGAGYVYPHDHPGHHAPQHYLPDALRGMRFYEPGTEGYEAQAAERLARWRRAVEAALRVVPRPGPAVGPKEKDAYLPGRGGGARTPATGDEG
jgi:putative ATPase